MVNITESLPALPRPATRLQNVVDIRHFLLCSVQPSCYLGITLPCQQLQMTKQRDPPSFSLYSWQPGRRHRARAWQQEARPTIWTSE